MLNLLAQMRENLGNTPAKFAAEIATIGSQRLERVKQSAHAMIGTMSGAGCLSRRARGSDRSGIRRISGCGMCGERSFHRRTGLHLARGPRTQTPRAFAGQRSALWRAKIGSTLSAQSAAQWASAA